RQPGEVPDDREAEARERDLRRPERGQLEPPVGRRESTKPALGRRLRRLSAGSGRSVGRPVGSGQSGPRQCDFGCFAFAAADVALPFAEASAPWLCWATVRTYAPWLSNPPGVSACAASLTSLPWLSGCSAGAPSDSG